MFRRLLWNVELWLHHGRVHGDLSAFNVLYWEGRAVVIDFPQAVDPDVNPNAYQLLARDLTNLCSYFRRYGVRADGNRLADDMWMRWKFGT
jgi:RIO kinase 1